MSTHSSIAILNLDGTVHAHYCHFDGDLSYNGLILYEHYQDIKKIKELISLGDMNSLDIEVSIPEGIEHTFNKRHEGISIFYGRDRGEDNIDTKVYSSIEEYLKNGDFQYYDYIFDEKIGEWFVINKEQHSFYNLFHAILNSNKIPEEKKEYIKRLKHIRILDKNLPEKNITELRIKL